MNITGKILPFTALSSCYWVLWY